MALDSTPPNASSPDVTRSPRQNTPKDGRPRVGLFVTCLVDLYRPTVGFAAVKLLEDAGCIVDVPQNQTCCGQPAYNSGDAGSAREIGAQVIAAFERFDYVVAPSGSCAGMLKAHLPELFVGDGKMHARAIALADKVHELMSFLVDELDHRPDSPPFRAQVTYHDACSGLRELGISTQPRQLLAGVEGVELTELVDREVCCGFGGTFCVKYPEISTRMVGNKVADITNTGADTVLAGDLGCLLNIAGRLHREGHRVSARHVAEVIAGMTDTPGIGEPS